MGSGVVPNSLTASQACQVDFCRFIRGCSTNHQSTDGFSSNCGNFVITVATLINVAASRLPIAWCRHRFYSSADRRMHGQYCPHQSEVRNLVLAPRTRIATHRQMRQHAFALPLIAALTPDHHRFTIIDENVETIDFDHCAGPIFSA